MCSLLLTLCLALIDQMQNTIHVVTTAYCSGYGLACGIAPKWDHGVTATGAKARRGLCAGDPQVVPFGSVFHIPGYGICEVQDTGSAVRGYHLDLFMDTPKEAIEWGRRMVSVTILRWGTHGKGNTSSTHRNH